MKQNLFTLTFAFSFLLFPQEGWQFYCDNQSAVTTVIASDVNNDGSIDECDYFSAGMLVCPNSEWALFFLEDIEGLGCNTDIDSWSINNDSGEDYEDVNNLEDCEEGVFISVGMGDWMDEVSWNITSCDGAEVIAEGGAPYNNCINLPEYFVINMYDSFGDGWSGNVMYIDGLGEFTLQSGNQDSVANSDDCITDVVSDNNQEWFEFICNGEPIYSYMTEEEWYQYISTLDCDEFDSDFGSSWTPVFISFNANSVEINDIWFEIYDCAGNLYLQASAPYEGYTELPNDFTIAIVDYAGDGWSEGSSIYIDGYGEYTLDSGYYDTISNCNDDDDSNDDSNGDSNGDSNDSEMNCEEGVLISVDGGVWQDEVSWIITDCDGADIIAEGGAPFEDCIILPDNYVIIMNDSWGDGWNGNYMAIGDDIYTLEYGPENIIAVGDCDIDWWDGNDPNSNWNGEWNTDSYFTYECNGEVITVTFNDTANTILDFNGDGIIDFSELLFYASENYDCEEGEVDVFSDIWDDIIWNDSNWDLDALNWDDDFDWDMNNDGFDDFTWDDFDWDSIWDDYMFSDIDWENTPWGEIIDLGINPEDLINYLIELGDGRISAFDWRDFIDYFNNSVVDLDNHVLDSRYVMKSINILGQIIDPNSKGVVFKLFNDGSMKKEYIVK